MPRTNLSSQFTLEQRKTWKPKIVARNTFKYEKDGATVIRLHGTDVVEKRTDGSCVLNSGGWRTVTTKDRMQSHMPDGYALLQEKGIWYVVKIDHGYAWDKTNPRVPYFDGIEIPKCFVASGKSGEKELAKQEKERLAIRKFVARLDKLQCLPDPSSGDCFYCQMRTVKEGKPLGEAIGDSDHIRSHIKEGYLHGSLILNALRFVGYRDPQFIGALENQDMARGKKPTRIKRALKRYLYRQLGLVS